AAMIITGIVAEVSYRYVETPIRRGDLGRWWRAERTVDWQRMAGCAAVTSVALVVPLGAFYSSVRHVDPAEGGADVAFELDVPVAEAEGLDQPNLDAAAGDTATSSGGTTGQPPTEASVSSETPTTAVAAAPTVPVTAPVLPRKLVIVGDSQAHSLAINLPDGIESTFSITDGSVEGCSVYDDGSVRSERQGFTRSFSNCTGWAAKWADAATSADAEVALVVLGAWDVFDVEVDGQLVQFGSAAADQRFLDDLRSGVTALTGAGVHVALLEVPCMRPKDVEGAGVPALPERGDDQRVAHLNELMRQVAADDPSMITFVSGPTEWCTDPAISTDLGYRWDGVHVYKPGAKLIYETIAPALLAIPIPA
ncbi:MAG: SGNH hydrolase domain-containing protein, partial [Ilumatobacteraceae bacterium]